MDIDHFKPATATQEQLDMMMMLQMDKLPDFYGSSSNNDGSTSSGDFLSMGLNNGNGSMNSIGCSMAQLYDSCNPNPNASSPAFLNHLSALSFSDNSANPNMDTSSTGGPSFLNNSSSSSQKRNSMAAMREMIFRIAAMQPIHIDPESVKPPKRRNVKISKDPQSVAARHRRERISARIRILQRLVPGGTKMDTASMLDEAIHYVKFLKTQVQSLERVQASNITTRSNSGIGFPVTMSNGSYWPNISNNSYQTSPSYEDA